MKYTYFKTHDYDNSQTVVSLLEKSIAKNRDKIAIVCNEQRLSYGELGILTDKIADYLKQQGAGREKVVSILLPRSEMMVVAAIGALKAGAAYQPLDPSYPDDRLAFMIADAESVALITDESLQQRLPSFGGAVLDISAVSTLPAAETKNNDISPQDLFILLYTSGSTGIPKGVMLEHGNLVAFIDWYIRYYSLNGESRTAAYASFGFDANMMDTYPILCAGGQLHIISEEIRLDFPSLRRYFEENKITHSFITTQVGRQYAKSYPASKSLKHLSVGGEALVPIDPPEYAFYNGYGPTECTIFSTIFKVEQRYKTVPIGYPLDNLRLYVVDEKGQQVENGTEGELWISGPQVARGYLKRPEKTAEVFIKNPFSNAPGYERIYRTGDIVRGCDDGKIEFVGRRDGQVKIRGFRVELTEIEEVIRRFEGVEDATVAAFDKPAGGKYIAAYVVSSRKLDIEALQNFIAQSKPPYMVPAFTMQIDSIPLNQNQKVDRKKLPLPEYQAEDYEAPETETEKLIAEKMAQVLGLEAVSVNDDFFQIGGDSITTILLVTECAHDGVNISSIYEYRTPRALARYCDSMERGEDIPAKNAEARQKIHPLTYAQMVNMNLQLENPQEIYCNNPRLFLLTEDVDLPRMKKAANKVLANHPVLRTKLITDETGKLATDDEGKYLQTYDESLFRPLDIHRMTGEEFEALKKEGLVRPFTLTNGDIWRGGIYQTPAAAYLFLDFHHFIIDGFSVQILLNEIYECYRDENYVLPQDYYFYLLEAALHGKDNREAKAYCEKLFHGENSLPEAEMPLKPDHETESKKGAVTMNPIPVPKDKLRGNVPYITACALAVAAYNNSDRALVQFTHYGRNSSISMSSVGIFINRYPVLLVREADDTPASLIAKVQEQVSFAEAHVEYPFLENIARPDRGVRFIYHKDILDLGKFSALCQKLILLDTHDSDMTDNLYGISIIDNSADENLVLLERYAANCYDKESNERFRKLFFEAASYLAGN